MRVEIIHGRYLLCRGIIPRCFVKPGQVWAPADGSNRTVTVEEGGSFVRYSWIENSETKSHRKENFAFQCRYCLVLDGPEIPEELQ